MKPLLTPDRKGAVYTNAVLSLIRGAKSQLLFQNQYIKMAGAFGGNFLDTLANELVKKSKEVADFRIILRTGDSFIDDVQELKRRGMKVNDVVKKMSNTHTKGIIVDGKKVLVGSHNWSLQGVTLNRDASLLFDDREVAEFYTKAFDADWARAGAPKLESVALQAAGGDARTPRLAVGDAPPPGYVRVPLSVYLEG